MATDQSQRLLEILDDWLASNEVNPGYPNVHGRVDDANDTVRIGLGLYVFKHDDQ